MSIFASFVFLCFVQSTICKTIDQIEPKFCNEDFTNHYIRNLDLGFELTDGSILIKEGEVVGIRFGIDLMKRYPPEEFSKVTLELKLTHLGIPIPCVNVDHSLIS